MPVYKLLNFRVSSFAPKVIPPVLLCCHMKSDARLDRIEEDFLFLLLQTAAEKRSGKMTSDMKMRTKQSCVIKLIQAV